jgi:glycosyl transferase family 2
MPSITSIINVSDEGSIARASIESALLTERFSRHHGIEVDTLIIADRPSPDTRMALESYEGLATIVEIDVGDLASARNHGASIARGDFIGFLDGDDLWSKRWLLNAWTVAKDDHRIIVHPQYSIVFGCGEDHVYEHVSMTDSAFNKRYLIFDNYWTSLSFSRKETYLSIPYQRNEIEAGFGFEDWKWNCDTIRENYRHVVAKNTFHFIRRRYQSMRTRSKLANCLTLPSPRFFDPADGDAAPSGRTSYRAVRRAPDDGAGTATRETHMRSVNRDTVPDAGKHIFQSFWWGDQISPYEALCMRSFVDRGHGFDLYTYSSDLKVPEGVRLRDAGEFFPISEFFTYETGPGAGSPSAFANLFRYKLLATKGGWWVDTDVLCLSDRIPEFDQFFAFEDDKVVNTAILYFQARNPVMICSLEVALRVRGNAKWGQIGPQLITNVIDGLGLNDRIQPKGTCYAIHWSEAFDLLKPSKLDSIEERTHFSLFLHIWNELFRRSGIDKTLLPPRGSFLRQLADHHPVDGWRGEYDAERLNVMLETVRSAD